jgi:hypothetical protein
VIADVLCQAPLLVVSCSVARASPVTTGGAVFVGPYCCWAAFGDAEPMVENTATVATSMRVASDATSVRDLRFGRCIG